MAVCLFLANNCDGSLALKLKSKLKDTREEENYASENVFNGGFEKKKNYSFAFFGVFLATL